jgi:hypothetical protein
MKRVLTATAKKETRNVVELASLLGEVAPVGSGAGSGGVGGGDDLGEIREIKGAAKRAGSIEEGILWVYNNLQSSVGVDDAPSPGAWTLLCDLRKDGKLRASFWTSIIPKFLPKNLGEGEEDEDDVDGSVQMDLIDRIRREKLKAEGVA